MPGPASSGNRRDGDRREDNRKDDCKDDRKEDRKEDCKDERKDDRHNNGKPPAPVGLAGRTVIMLDDGTLFAIKR